jgi:methylisocitrate lyase
MTALVAADHPVEPAGRRLRRLLAAPGIVGMPGVYNGLSALQAKAAGFSALYLSGAGLSASMGLPDLGIMTIDDVAAAIRQITRVSDLPLLVDADTGYGEALNVMHMMRTFEQAGAAAVHIEDQVLPKKCGHLNDKRLVSAQEMAAKVAAAAKARRDMLLIARTDAAASEGIEGAIARARAYVAAGADAVFADALVDGRAFRAFANAIDVPKLANMTEFGRSQALTVAELEALGYKMVIWPASAFRVAARAQEELYAALRRDGSTQTMISRMQTRAELYTTLRYHDYEALDASIVRSVLPEAPPVEPARASPSRTRSRR